MIKFGLVGCGFMAADHHLPALAKIMRETNDLRPAFCCDIVEEKAKSLAERFDFAAY